MAMPAEHRNHNEIIGTLIINVQQQKEAFAQNDVMYTKPQALANFNKEWKDPSAVGVGIL